MRILRMLTKARLVPALLMLFVPVGSLPAASQQFHTLHDFSALDGSGHNPDGANPRVNLIQAGDGNLYGTTSDGGTNGYGTLFRITPSGAFTTLHDFTGADGSAPNALIQAQDGKLYGTTGGGGANGH